MIYLASPYSHPDAAVRAARFQAVCRAAAVIMRAGQHVFSPIAHGHPIAAFGLPTDWSYWQAFARWHLERCDEMCVLTFDGWRESEGIRAEIRIAGECGKPVRYVAPEGVGHEKTPAEAGVEGAA